MSTKKKPVAKKKPQSPVVPPPAGATGKEPNSFVPAAKGTSAPKQASGAKSPVIEVAGQQKVSPTGPVTSGIPIQQPPAQPAPASSTQKPVTDRVGPRRVRLAVSRVDPWSVMKLSFLLSIAIGIMIVVSAVVFWLVLDKLHVFTDIDAMIKDILGADTKVNVLQFVELNRVVSLSTIIAVVDVVLLTALGTIGAFLYNVVAALVGGIHLTMTDD
ncbi:DUF3566 domain-containing protein [Jonesiaceae bacterium BS-20]|uniref:DUF3566 domain-containing protein n=1 Tax=Jonesiaceae bacterium BS-20 TaxID=3120821 RepID=A0AAU7DVG2_9MICO